MIPCAAKCPHYCEGCHKTCAAWREYTRRNKAEQRAKLDWLREKNRQNAEVVRSFRSLTPSHSVY